MRKSVCKLVRFVKLMGTCIVYTMGFINNRSPHSNELLAQIVHMKERSLTYMVKLNFNILRCDRNDVQIIKLSREIQLKLVVYPTN